MTGQVTDNELEASFAGPAVHANKFYLTVVDAGIRLTFMEALGATVSPTFRTAVLVSANDAVALRDQLVDMLRELQASDAEPRPPHSGAH